MAAFENIKTETNRQTVDIREVTAKLYKKYAQYVDPSQVQFTCYVARSIAKDIVLDPDWVRKSLDTMIGNAVRYTRHGRVHIHITTNTKKAICIIVADTGIGIPKNRLDTILDARSRDIESMVTKNMKMRLCAIKIFAESMSGRLSIHSNPGRGTEVMLTLQPLKAPLRSYDLKDNDILPQSNLPEKSKPGALWMPDNSESVENPRSGFSRRRLRRAEKNLDPRQFKGKKILVVEDIIANQEVLRSLLEPAGCHVITADNGQEAVDLTNTQVFDAVLMDIRMPIMNGVEATAEIRKTAGPNQAVPIIALTADASAENNAECLAAGADVFLTKPVVISELFSAIRYATKKRASSNPQRVQKSA